MIINTYLSDFVDYYRKAAALQRRNHYAGKALHCGDPLMDHVTIYDTVLRRHAGFSNILEDLHGRVKPTREQKQWGLKEWLYVYGVHRMTGSGASFYPPTAGDKRHGYMNSICPYLIKCATRRQMIDAIEAWDRPMFTSKGNQPPPFPKPQGGFTTGGKFYLCTIWPSAVDEIIYQLSTARPKPTIRQATQLITDWNVGQGYKRFTFTMTAFTMDIAEYHPSLISPESQCNYGANALLALDAMFDTTPRRHRPGWYDEVMELLREHLTDTGVSWKSTGARPMDVEDVLCDVVRYWLQFVPKVGYEHLTAAQRENRSSISKQRFEEFINARK